MCLGRGQTMFPFKWSTLSFILSICLLPSLFVLETHLPLRVSRCVCFCAWVFKEEVQVIYRKPRWVSHNQINVICSQTLTWPHKPTHKQQQTNAHQTLCTETHKTQMFTKTFTKRVFFLPTHSLSPTLITTSQGLISFSNLMTWLQKSPDAFSSETRNGSAGMAQTIKSQGEILTLHWKVRAFQQERKQVLLSSQS